MKRLVVLLSSLLISLFAGLTLCNIFDVSPVIISLVSFLGSFIPLPGGSFYSLLFTAPGGIATPFAFNIKGLPQFLSWNNVVALTSLKIETQEDGVLHDWVAASIAVINGYLMPGAQAANIQLFRLASGFLSNKNVTISGVTSAAGAIGFYGFSDNVGGFTYKSSNAQILALEPCVFTNFTAIWVPTMAAVTDRCEIEYNNGQKTTYNINDLAAFSSMYQELPQIMVSNHKQLIKSATFTCAAASPAYVLSIK